MAMNSGEMAGDLRSSAALAAAAEECVERDPSAMVLMFRSLADPARLAILRHLALGEHRVIDLTNHVGLAQSTTSAHLVCLRDCGLVSARTVGRASVYSLAVGEELMALMSSAERLLAATGDAVTHCATNELPPAGARGSGEFARSTRAEAGRDG